MGKELPVFKGPWSHSRATACPRALYKEKVERAPPEPRPERFISLDRRDFGSLLHEGADNQLLSMVSGKDWLNTVDLSHELISSEEGEGDNIVHPFAHLAPIAAEIEERMEIYVNSFRVEWDMTHAERDAIIRENMLGHEMRLAVDADGKPCNFNECPSDGWRGIVDYAEDKGKKKLLILDNKNRPAIFTDSELKKDEQLSGYLDLTIKHFPGQFEAPYAMGIYYFEFGYTQIVEIDDDQLKANVNRLHAQARHKETLTLKTLVPQPGFGKCQYCDYIHSCDAGKDFMKGGALMPMDMKQARELAGWVMVHEEKVKAARKALNAFTAEHGAVVLDDKTEVGHNINRGGVTYDKNATLRVLKGLINTEKLKGKLSDFTALKLDAVKKAAKAKVVDEALESARSPKVDRKFDFFRPGTRKGVRVKKVGRKLEINPEDLDFADDDGGGVPRKTKERVKTRKKK